MSIKFEKVDYSYSPGTTMEKRGLDNVSFELADNKFIALIGHTGSGKSNTLAKMISEYSNKFLLNNKNENLK